MSNHFSMGAINKLTNEYEYPRIAQKGKKYICPECNKYVNFCKGQIKQPYFPSGKTIKIQGYEHYVLNELLKTFEETDIVTGAKNVPTVWYLGIDGKKHRHYVDIFIPKENLCIEVKSTWTAKNKLDNIFLKQNAAKELGYKYEIWIYNQKGICIKKHI